MAPASPPTVQRALVLDAYPPRVQKIPTPQLTPGSAIVRVLAANILAYAKQAYSGELPYPLPKPLIVGSSAVGRIAVVGPDATALQPGHLVLIDIYIRGRDDRNAAILMGLHEGATEGSRRLARGEWKDSTYCEYVKMPLENLHPLNEQRLLGPSADGGLGYAMEDLTYLSTLAVPFGGLRDIDLKAGDTVVIAPATGAFGSAAVRVAIAMGASVVAIGRNKEALGRLAECSDRVTTMLITGNVEMDAKALQSSGPIDAYFDISPQAAAESTHIRSCLTALKAGGKMSFMGGIQQNVSLPLGLVMMKSLKLCGKFMYERGDIRNLIKMAESGMLRLDEGVKVGAKYGLEQWEEAFDHAAKGQKIGERVVIIP